MTTNIKRVVFSFVPCPETSMVASTRIARFLRDKMDAPLVWDETIGTQKPDVLVIVNGAFAFCKHLEPLSRAILAARRIVWVQNDYTIVPPICDGDATSPFRRAFVERREMGKSHLDFWTTCEKLAKVTPGSALINWNALTFEDLGPKKLSNWRAKHNGRLLYYGSHRAGRVPYFDRYFKMPFVPTTISSPGKKFAARYELVEHVPPMTDDMIAQIGRYAAGLYLEDKKSHSEYHSPPNRFYEMLSAGLPMIFQPEAGYTLRRAGYDPEPYGAKSGPAVKRLMDSIHDVGVAQRDAWLPKAREEHRKLTLDAVPLAWNAVRALI